jgi:hypothetical protein
MEDFECLYIKSWIKPMICFDVVEIVNKNALRMDHGRPGWVI